MGLELDVGGVDICFRFPILNPEFSIKEVCQKTIT